jgi:hypothetical protein
MLIISYMVKLNKEMRPVTPTIVRGCVLRRLKTTAASAEEKRASFMPKNCPVRRYMSSVYAIAGRRLESVSVVSLPNDR